MAAISQLNEKQRARFRKLRKSGQGNKARRFKQKILKSQRAPGTNAQGEVTFGPKLSKQIAKEEAFGQKLVDQFLPDIETLGTVDSSRAPEVQDLINQQSAMADFAGERSQEVQQGIQLAQQGLGGLTAQENDALRAQATRGLDRNFLASQRALANAQRRAGVMGAAGTAQFRDLAFQQGQAQRDLERDILLQNIAIQDQRRNAFNNLMQQVESREFGQQQQALGQLQGLTQQARGDELARQQFNIGQQANLLQGQQALFFGGQGIIQAKRNALANARAARQQREAAIAEANAMAQAYANAAQSTYGVLGGANLPSLGG